MQILLNLVKNQPLHPLIWQKEKAIASCAFVSTTKCRPPISKDKQYSFMESIRFSFLGNVVPFCVPTCCFL